MLLSGLVCWGQFATGAEAVCGTPVYDRAAEAAAFLYYDCGTDDWHLRVTAGGRGRTYRGSIASGQPFESLSLVSIESADSIQPGPFATPTPGPIDFVMKVGNAGQDGLDFSLTPGAFGCFDLTTPGNVPVYVGSDRASVTTPVQLGGEVGPCSNNVFTLSVADIDVVEGDAGTTSANFVLDLTPAPGAGVSVIVNYQTADAGATAGVDYDAVNDTVTFASGETQKIVAVTVHGDTAPEFDEAFELAMTGADVNAVTARATILNDDGLPPPACGAPNLGPFRNAENAVLLYWDCGTDNWHLRVTSSGAAARYETTLGSDLPFSRVEASSFENNDTLTPPPFTGPPNVAGPFAASMRVANAGLDGLDFDLQAGADGCVQIDSPLPPGTALYIGAEPIPVGDTSVRLGGDYGPCSAIANHVLVVDDIDIDEGDSGDTTAIFTLGLSPPPAAGESVTVNYQLGGGSATAGTDFEPVAGSIVFDEAVTERTLDVTVNGDTEAEHDETFELLFTSADTNAVTAVATIVNDDGVPPPACGKPAYNRATEAAVFLYQDCGTDDWHIRVTGGGQSQSYQGSLASWQLFPYLSTFSYEATDVVQPAPFSVPTAGPIDFVMAVGGSGQDGLDFGVPSGGAVCFELDAPPDLPVYGGSDRVVVGRSVSLPAFGPCLNYELTIDEPVVDETAGSVQFTLDLSPAPGPGEQIDLNYATQDGSALSGADYTAASGVVSFGAGQTQAMVTVAVIDDDDAENSEAFALEVSAAALGSFASTATILDDDAIPPTIQAEAPIRTRFYAPYDDVILRVSAEDADATDLTDLVTWHSPSGQQIGSGGELSVPATDIAADPGAHLVTAQVAEPSTGLMLTTTLDFPIVIEDATNFGPDSIDDGFDERVVIPLMDRGDVALVLEPYATLPTSGGLGARMNAIVASPDGGLWVNDMRGLLYDITSVGDPADPGAPILYLDLATTVGTAFRYGHSQQGFSHFAFHPEFAVNGRFFTVHSETLGSIPADFPLRYTVDKAGNPVTVSHHDVVSEWTADDPSAPVFTGTRREVLRIEQPYPDHNVGQIAFDGSLDSAHPDFGLLYIAVADGGSGVAGLTAPLDAAQDPTSPFGAILRVRPEPDLVLGKGYQIPAGNPFVADPTVLEEIWAYGLRNPHRISFDVTTGRMLISDIGADNVEEINIGEAGANYGWSIREGTFIHPDDAIKRAAGGSFDFDRHRSYVSPIPATDLSGTRYPAIQYDHNDSPYGSRGTAVADAHVYRGALALLQGKVVFGDFPDGRLFMADAAGLNNGMPAPVSELGMWVDEDLDGTSDLVLDLRNAVDPAGLRADIRIGVDTAGELYLTNKVNGVIFKVVDAVTADLGVAGPADYVPPIDLDAAGYLNVQEYGADPSGQTVSTAQIQLAIDDAIAQQRVLFFPPGTYLVDDTLTCMEPAQDPPQSHEFSTGCTLIGAAEGSRPTLRLVDNSPSFGDASVADATVANGVVTQRPTVKPVVHFWRQQAIGSGGSTDPELENSARNYNQVIRNIDIDLGHDNAGAVGIRHRGAEGSAIQHVAINVRVGFAGLYSFPSNGGLPADIDIVGGRYGIYAPKVRGGAHTIAGLRLSGQWDQPIVYGDNFPLTIVGFDITHDDGPILTPRQNGSDASGHLALIDGIIDLTGGGTGAAIENSDRAIYLDNVYVRGTPTIVDNLNDGEMLAAPSVDDWTQVVEYAYLDGADDIDALVNGVPDNTTRQTLATVIDPPTDLIARHVPPPALCSFDNPAMVDVMDFGAVGDGVTDDTLALRAAVAAADTVFLPKGQYLLSGTIDLGSDTRLCGVANVLTALVADPGWVEADFTPLLRTSDDAGAQVVLETFDVRTWDAANRVYHVDWRSGRESFVRSLNGAAGGPWPGSFDIPLVRMRINGNGGGRFFGYLQHISWDCMDPDCRLLLVDGTREPLRFYQYYSQYLKVGGGPMTELFDAVDVRFFGHKSENIIPSREQRHEDFFGTPWPTLMRITDSVGIQVLGAEGPSQAEPGRGLYEVTDSQQVSLVNIGRRGSGTNALHSEDSWYFVVEDIAGSLSSVDATGVLGLYRRD